MNLPNPTLRLARRLASKIGVPSANEAELKAWIARLDDNDWDAIQKEDVDQVFGPDEIANLKAWASKAKPEGAPAQTPPMNPTVQATPESLVSGMLEDDATMPGLEPTAMDSALEVLNAAIAANKPITMSFGPASLQKLRAFIEKPHQRTAYLAAHSVLSQGLTN